MLGGFSEAELTSCLRERTSANIKRLEALKSSQRSKYTQHINESIREINDETTTIFKAAAIAKKQGILKTDSVIDGLQDQLSALNRLIRSTAIAVDVQHKEIDVTQGLPAGASAPYLRGSNREGEARMQTKTITLSRVPIPFSSVESVLRAGSASLITLPELLNWLRSSQDLEALNDQAIWVARDSSIPSVPGFFRIDRIDTEEIPEVRITKISDKSYQNGFLRLPLEQRLEVLKIVNSSKEFPLSLKPNYSLRNIGIFRKNLIPHGYFSLGTEVYGKAKFAFVDKPGPAQDRMLRVLEREVTLSEEEETRKAEERESRREAYERRAEDAARQRDREIIADRFNDDWARRETAKEERQKREIDEYYHPPYNP